MKLSIGLLALGLATASLAAEATAFQEGAASPSETVSRWNELTSEQREQARVRFEEWKGLSAEERDQMLDRHKALGRARKRVIESLPTLEKKRLEGMPPRDRKHQLKPRLKSHLAEARKRVLEQAGIPPHEHKRPFKKVRKAIKNQTADTLLALEEEGVLLEGEAQRLLGLASWELRPELLRIHRRFILQNPPKEFLRLSEEERAELIDLQVEEFHNAMKKLRESRDRDHAPDGASVPPFFQDALHGKPPRPRPLPRVALERTLSVEQLQRIDSLQGEERHKELLQFLAENARRTLEQKGDGVRAVEKLETMSPNVQVRKLMKIIDPTLDRSQLRPPSPLKHRKPPRGERQDPKAPKKRQLGDGNRDERGGGKGRRRPW